MIRILFAIFLLCTSVWASDNTTTTDVLPNFNDNGANTTMLNDQLRRNSQAVNTIEGYFNSNNELSSSAGGTGTNITTFPNGALLIYDSGNLGIGTFNPGSANQILTSQGSSSIPTFSSTLTISQLTASGNIITTAGNIGVGTSHPGVTLDVAGNLRLSGHFTVTGGGPTVGSCSSAGSIEGGSTDFRGEVRHDNAASSTCTVNFGTAWATAPFCIAQDTTSNIHVKTSTTTTVLTMTGTSNYNNEDIIAWICIG